MSLYLVVANASMDEELSYDSEEDILYYNRGEAVQDSLDIGNVFVEFSGDGEIVGIEVLDASDFISDFTGEEFSSEDLENVLDAKIKVIRKGEFAIVALHFVIEKDGEQMRESVGVNLPSSSVAA